MMVFLDILMVTGHHHITLQALISRLKKVLINQLHNKVKSLGNKVQTEIISALQYNIKVLCPCHEGVQEKQMCSSTDSYPHHSVEVSCELQAPATLPYEESQDPLNRRLVDPELIWTLHRKEQSLAPASISTPHHQILLSGCNPATVHHHFWSNSLYHQGYKKKLCIIHVCE